MSASGFYSGNVVGAVRAPGQILQWNIYKLDPSGYRHWESGLYRPDAKTGLVGGFTAQKESGVALDFGEIKLTSDNAFWSNTVCFTFNCGEVNYHPDSYFDILYGESGINKNIKAFNLRFWLHNDSAFNTFQPTWYYLPSGSWTQKILLRDTTVDVVVIPSSMPSTANINRIDNFTFISGCYKNTEFSEFIYVVAKFPSGNVPLGTYGGLGSGNFTFKLSYDWTGINAGILDGDVVDCPL